MADTPAPPRSSGGSFSQRMSHKVGPLPVWVWAIIGLVVGYYLYKKYQASSASTTATGTTPATASTPIPSSDQSGGGAGSASGSTGTTTPTDVTTQGNGLAGDITTESNGPAANGAASGGLITQRENTSFIPATSGASGISSYSSAGHGL